MPVSRRRFIQHGAVAAAMGLVARQGWGLAPSGGRSTFTGVSTERADAAAMRALALRAVDAARTAGARYADARVIRTIGQAFAFAQDTTLGASVTDSEILGIGVRALVDGCWGFAASPYLLADEAARLGADAVLMAKANAAVSPRAIEWAPLPAITGAWTSPMRIDPFEVPIEERIDFMTAWRQAIVDAPKRGVLAVPASSGLRFVREERYGASTEGMDVAQTIVTTSGAFALSVAPRDWRARDEGRGARMMAHGIGAGQIGWEQFLDAKIGEQVPALLDEGYRLVTTREQPVPLGRYDVVFDAETMASMVGYTIGMATELDRALGEEANAGGTSFLGPAPLAQLGTRRVAATGVTITANRTLEHGLATVKWDDEGVAPDDFTLVTNGVVTDYQTTRSQAALLAPWYQKIGKPVRSHGCCTAASPFDMPIQRMPNLALAPSATAASFDDLVAGTKRGVAIVGADVSMDFQAKRGMTTGGRVRQIVDGKLGPVLSYAGCLLSSEEFWKSVTALGGTGSVEHHGLAYGKGQPYQPSTFTVASVPAIVTNQRIIDTTRLG